MDERLDHNHSKQTSTTTEGGARVPLDNRASNPTLLPPQHTGPLRARLLQHDTQRQRRTTQRSTRHVASTLRSHLDARMRAPCTKQPHTIAPATLWPLRARLLQHDVRHQRRTTQHSTRHVAGTLRSHLDARTRAPREPLSRVATAQRNATHICEETLARHILPESLQQQQLAKQKCKSQPRANSKQSVLNKSSHTFLCPCPSSMDRSTPPALQAVALAPAALAYASQTCAVARL